VNKSNIYTWSRFVQHLVDGDGPKTRSNAGSVHVVVEWTVTGCIVGCKACDFLPGFVYASAHHSRRYRRRANTRVSALNQPRGAAEPASSGAGSVARTLRWRRPLSEPSLIDPATQTNPVLDTLEGESSGLADGSLSSLALLVGPLAGANGSSRSGNSASPTPGSSPPHPIFERCLLQ
jgi:hypothetical protein